MILTNDKTEITKSKLRQAINDDVIVLPDTIETGRVYRTKYFKYDNRGCIELRFKIIEEKDSLQIIQLYFITDDYSSHQQINADGSITYLENFEEQFGWPVFKDEEETEKEHKRIREHNENVFKILVEKGFKEN